MFTRIPLINRSARTTYLHLYDAMMVMMMIWVVLLSKELKHQPRYIQFNLFPNNSINSLLRFYLLFVSSSKSFQFTFHQMNLKSISM